MSVSPWRAESPVDLKLGGGGNVTGASGPRLLPARALSCRVATEDTYATLRSMGGRGLHSLTSQLNLSALYGTRVARRGCVARVTGVLGGVLGVLGVFVCQTRLKLSLEVDECKPLMPGATHMLKHMKAVKGMAPNVVVYTTLLKAGAYTRPLISST